MRRRRPKERISPEEREMRLEELGRNCIYCGAPGAQLDHVVPLAKGGAHAVWNLVPACLQCNYGKRASNPRTWAERHGVSERAQEVIAEILRRHEK